MATMVYPSTANIGNGKTLTEPLAAALADRGSFRVSGLIVSIVDNATHVVKVTPGVAQMRGRSVITDADSANITASDSPTYIYMRMALDGGGAATGVDFIGSSVVLADDAAHLYLMLGVVSFVASTTTVVPAVSWPSGSVRRLGRAWKSADSVSNTPTTAFDIGLGIPAFVPARDCHLRIVGHVTADHSDSGAITYAGLRLDGASVKAYGSQSGSIIQAIPLTMEEPLVAGVTYTPTIWCHSSHAGSLKVFRSRYSMMYGELVD